MKLRLAVGRGRIPRMGAAETSGQSKAHAPLGLLGTIAS